MFPYIRQLEVNNCYAYKNLTIPKEPLTDFSHIILTGKNGSGKTTILNRIALQIQWYRDGKSPSEARNYLINMTRISKNKLPYEILLSEFSDLNIILGSDPKALKESDNYIYSFFKANRRVKLKDVQTVKQENEFIKDLKNEKNQDSFVSEFKQYLVNKKVFEAFEILKSNDNIVNENRIFFDNLNTILRNIFEDKGLELEFVQENFDFLLKFSDGRKITFNQLSEGFSAFISILMSLLMQVDLHRKQLKDYRHHPSGIVLIDEPETHFHLSMQYEILPLLTNLFPKIQFIIATHSPAIISSLENAYVFDLSSQQQISGWQVGSSYSELMIKHFGLDNEFSPVADRIIMEVSKAFERKDIGELKNIIAENERILTPSLKFEIENQIIYLKSKL